MPGDDRLVMQCADTESILGACAHCYRKCGFTQQPCNAKEERLEPSHNMQNMHLK